MGEAKVAFRGENSESAELADVPESLLEFAEMESIAGENSDEARELRFQIHPHKGGILIGDFLTFDSYVLLLSFSVTLSRFPET